MSNSRLLLEFNDVYTRSTKNHVQWVKFMELVSKFDRPLIIGCDVDGTVTGMNWPKLGPIYREASFVLSILINAGHFVFLNTMRSGRDLDKAFIKITNTLQLNEGKQIYKADQIKQIYNLKGMSDLKVYADFYIDDMDINAPFIEIDGVQRYDWNVVIQNFLKKGAENNLIDLEDTVKGSKL